MPYVAPGEALNLRAADLEAIRREAGPPPWRRALVGTGNTRWALSEWPAGFTTAPHWHPQAEEVFLVLGGRAVFRFGPQGTPAGEGEEEVAAGEGTLLMAPAGLAHTIHVPGPESLLMLVSVTPNEDRADETVEPGTP